MRNYVIINGVNSLTIQGLAINNLPPITKPMIRTQREEIDGRDGDIVTELGYSAYDKQIEIGLWGTYDINDIIKYFTGEGTIVFSNEEDKYYNFKILDQIDYQKLLKFKTATITFHCQPFKYPLEEEPVEAEITTLTGTGETITLNNTEEAPMEIVYKGNTLQNGTPTPDSPVPIQVVSGDNSIVVCGKNLVFSKIANENISRNGLLLIDNSFDMHIARVTQGETYTISTNDATNGFVGGFFYDLPMHNMFTYDNQRVVQDNNKTFTAPITGYVAFRSQAGYEYAQLEKGTTASEFEPYKGASYPISLGDIELCKIGTYQDKIFKNTPNTTDYDSNLEDNVWYLKKEIGKVVLDGSENWALNSSSGDSYRYWLKNTTSSLVFTNIFTNIISGGEETLVGKLLCNYFTQKIFEQTYIGAFSINVGANENQWLLVNVSETSVANFKTWLSTHNTIVYYVLSTPTYTLIEDSTLIEELESMKKSKEGQTNISQTNNDLPFELDVSVTFLTPMEINNIGNIYAKPILTIEGTGNIGVVLNDIQILDIDLTNNGKIAIDVPKLEAYNPDDDTLLNRLVTGDYMKLLINEGENTITFTGNVSGATLKNYIRWI